MLPDHPHDQAQLFYLVLLGMAIAVGLFSSYRKRLGQAAQHAAIWGLIFIAVVLAVGFKDSIRHMLLGDVAQQIDDHTVALRRSNDGHFYATLGVNGENVRFLVDTGATNLVLTREDAETAGIDTDGLSFVVPSLTANGRVMSAPVRLNSITLAGFTDLDVRATVNGGDLHKSLLGMSYLELYRTWRVEGDTMFLSR
jgi:aspartyl protease family protein